MSKRIEEVLERWEAALRADEALEQAGLPKDHPERRELSARLRSCDAEVLRLLDFDPDTPSQPTGPAPRRVIPQEVLNYGDYCWRVIN